MTSQKEMVEVIKILKKEIGKFTDPSITQISDETEDPFKVLISCILSLRTRDATTTAASERLFRLAETPERMLKLPVKQIEKAIYPVSFYRTKAVRIRGICKDIIGKFEGSIPETMEDLLSLKGVGRKTANITMIYGHNKANHIAVDTHVHRVPNRMGWLNTKTPEQTEQELVRIIPRRHWQDLNNLLVTFGQNVCRPVGPKCYECPVEKHCRYEKKNLR